jgi:hypothetical protein
VKEKNQREGERVFLFLLLMAVVLRRCLSSWYLLLSRESVQHRNSYSLGSLRAPPAYLKLSSCSCFSSTSRSLAHNKLHHLRCSTTNPSFSDFSSLSVFPAATQIKAVDVGRDVWAEAETWVVFSDLHLSRRTCDICMEVLQTVYEEAVAQYDKKNSPICRRFFFQPFSSLIFLPPKYAVNQ